MTSRRNLARSRVLIAYLTLIRSCSAFGPQEGTASVLSYHLCAISILIVLLRRGWQPDLHDRCAFRLHFFKADML